MSYSIAVPDSDTYVLPDAPVRKKIPVASCGESMIS